MDNIKYILEKILAGFLVIVAIGAIGALIIGIISILTDWTGVWYQWVTVIVMGLIACFAVGFAVTEVR